jgi:hypothetical protein
VDVFNEQKEFITKAVWNKSMQHGTHKINGVPRRSQDPDCKGHFKIPTIINGITSIIGNDTSQKNPKRNNNMMKPIKPRSNNPESNTVHKVNVLGDSHLKHCVLELEIN